MAASNAFHAVSVIFVESTSRWRGPDRDPAHAVAVCFKVLGPDWGEEIGADRNERTRRRQTVPLSTGRAFSEIHVESGLGAGDRAGHHGPGSSYGHPVLLVNWHASLSSIVILGPVLAIYTMYVVRNSGFRRLFLATVRRFHL
jgi:hypothetical protein